MAAGASAPSPRGPSLFRDFIASRDCPVFIFSFVKLLFPTPGVSAPCGKPLTCIFSRSKRRRYSEHRKKPLHTRKIKQETHIQSSPHAETPPQCAAYCQVAWCQSRASVFLRGTQIAGETSRGEFGCRDSTRSIQTIYGGARLQVLASRHRSRCTGCLLGHQTPARGFRPQHADCRHATRHRIRAAESPSPHRPATPTSLIMERCKPGRPAVPWLAAAQHTRTTQEGQDQWSHAST